MSVMSNNTNQDSTTSSVFLDNSSSMSDKISTITPLFPAYGACSSSTASSECGAQVRNEWLINKSFTPGNPQSASLDKSRECKETEDENKREHSERNDAENAEEKNSAVPISDDQKENFSCSVKREKKHKKHRKHRSHSRSPQKSTENEQRDAESVYKIMSKMVFIEETGLAPERAFCVDSKPDKQNFAFATFYHKHTAIYNKINCPALGTMVTKDKSQKSSPKHDRYWHKNNFILLLKDKNVLNFAKPVLNNQCDAINYIPLEFSATELKNISGKETNDTAELKLLNGAETSMEEQPVRSSQEQYLYLKTQEYNKALRENPSDEEKWLEFVAFQDEIENVSNSERNKRQANTMKDTALLEKKIAILDKSLASNPGSIPLAITKLHLLSEFGGEIDEILKEWKQLVFLHPNNTSLWQQYIFFVQSHLSYFTVSRMCKLYKKCIGTLNKLICGTFRSHLPSPDLEDKTIDIFFQYCCFLRQCGYSEKAIATFQALIEFNMFQPSAIPKNSSQENFLTFFEPFWDSGAPRFGEDGALGWDKVLAEKKLISPQNPKSNEINLKEDEIIGKAGTKAQTWLEFELLREEHYWLPWRPEIEAKDEDDCEDPERSVLVDDVSEILFFLQSERTQVLAIVQFLRFLGVEFQESNGISCWNTTDCSNQYIIEVPDDVHPFLLNTKTLCYLDEHKEILNLPLLASHHRYTPFIEKVFEQAIKLFSPHYSQFLSLCWVQFRINRLKKCSTHKMYRRELRNAKKLTKSLLKEEINRNNLYLWKEYGRIEHLHGNFEEVEKVFQTALLTYPSIMTNQRDVWEFVQTYVELHLGLDSVKGFGITLTNSTENSTELCKARSLWMLCFLGSFEQYEPTLITACSQIPATKILKARNGFQKFVNSQESGVFDGNDILVRPKTLLVTSTICFAYFQYLTQGMASAASIYENILRKLDDNLLNSNNRISIRLEMESIFASYLQLFALHSNTAVVPLKSVRSVLLRALDAFPHNSYFLWLFLDLETGSGIANHFRKYFAKILLRESTASLTEWLFAVVAELKCHAKLQEAMQCATIPTTGITWKIRSLFERALKMHKLCHSVLLWRMYIKFEAQQGDANRTKAIFYQALQHCPWSKVLYVDGIKYFPNDIQDILDIVVEKGLRVRTPIEEIQLLLQHAGVNIENKEEEAMGPASPDVVATETDL